MCGIAGVFAYGSTAPPLDPEELRQISAYMRNRGPDGEGIWIAGDLRVGFAHRRLSIIDLSERAQQPMWSLDRTLVVTFNGEIYNHQALRSELERSGCTFQTTSDTEVLLHLFRRYREGMVTRLRGMFAFAIWDTISRTLFLARDHYGIKPLYYADTDGTFRFGSQTRALISGGKLSQAPDTAGWVGFMLHGFVPEPFTTYQTIKSLPAGCTMIVDESGAQTPRRFFSVARTYAQSEPASGKKHGLNDLREILLDSVRHHLVADVPIGCFLSSGIDSCTLLALMRESTSASIKAVTLTFPEFKNSIQDEAPLAAIAARDYDADHHVRVIDRDEFVSDLPQILSAMDQPSIDGVNSYFVSKAAHELGLKVAISGLGGDELFGGYESFKDIPAWVRACAPFSAVPGLGPSVRIAIATAQRAHRFGSPKMAGMIEYGGKFAGAYLLRRGLFMPWELNELFDEPFARDGIERLAPLELIEEALHPDPGSDFARVAAAEAQLYMRSQLLRDTDWSSMAHSLEVRVPLVDHRLLTTVAGFRPHPSKQDLARTPSRALPSELINRRKSGFATPIGAWLEEAAHMRVPTNNSNRTFGGHNGRRWARALVQHWPAQNAPAMREPKLF